MLGITGWMVLGLALYSLGITLLTFWIAARLWGGGQALRIWSPWVVAGNVVWSAILFLASVIAVRYIERLDDVLPGYATYALVGFLLSLMRARLELRASESRAAGGGSQRVRLSRAEIIHNLAYFLLALVLFLLVSWLAGGGPANPSLLIPLFIGALLPDLDSPDSVTGRLLPAISRPLAVRLGHKQAWHTPAAALLVALVVSLPMFLVGGSLVVPSMLLLGFAAHLLLDLLQPQGIMLLWPFGRNRYCFPGAPIQTYGSIPERRLSTGLGAAALILLVLVGLGPEPAPPPAPIPSYEQTLERYHDLRGRYLVFASLQGTWQTGGLVLSGRFEVLSALVDSYVLLDRYTGKVFTAGRSPQDHVYVDRISLETGSQVQIKPVEIRLVDQPLAGGLAVLYEMQREPGLEHIYVFGDLVLAADPAGNEPHLALDHSLTGVPRIEAEESRHYRLQYVTAADLIELASTGTEVETADLLVVATYSSPPAGPTATPLPPVPGNGEAAP
jgi:membrane-bound metal-dependent hydrolase YbcI (DUF457 family)